MKKTKSLEKHIGYWLRFVSNHVSGSFGKGLANFEISIGEWVVLKLLNEQTLSPAEIATGIGMTRGATSKILEKLFNKQLIHRSESFQDRRFQEISLSAKGKEMLPRLMKVADQNERNFFGHLSETDKRTLIHLLKGIAARNQMEGIPIH